MGILSEGVYYILVEMPALYRTIVPRIRKSLATHGVVETLRLSLGASLRLFGEYRRAKTVFSAREADPFDVAHGVETSQRIHQTDLKIKSPHRVCGTGTQSPPSYGTIIY
jgi:hypothetical protein